MKYEEAIKLKDSLVKELLIPAIEKYAEAEMDKVGEDFEALVNGIALVPSLKNNWLVTLYTRRYFPAHQFSSLFGKYGNELVLESIGEIRVLGGVSPGNYIAYPNGSTGTLGCYVRDREGGIHLLSNNHVLTNFCRGKIGDRILHPGVTDTGMNTIAHVSKLEPIKFSGPMNELDCGLARLAQQEPLPLNEISGIGKIDGFMDAADGLFVQKTGFGSQHTVGKIVTKEATIAVSYGSNFFRRREAIFQQQLLIRGEPATPHFARIGDSGSLLVDYQGGNRAVGLIFAGSENGITFANPINKVLSTLLVDIF